MRYYILPAVIGGIGQGICLLLFKRKVLRFLPFYPLAVWLLFAGLTYFGVFGKFSFGVLAGEELIALVMLVMAAFAAVGIALAWLVYGGIVLVRRIRSGKRGEKA